MTTHARSKIPPSRPWYKRAEFLPAAPVPRSLFRPFGEGQKDKKRANHRRQSPIPQIFPHAANCNRPKRLALRPALSFIGMVRFAEGKMDNRTCGRIAFSSGSGNPSLGILLPHGFFENGKDRKVRGKRAWRREPDCPEISGQSGQGAVVVFRNKPCGINGIQGIHTSLRRVRFFTPPDNRSAIATALLKAVVELRTLAVFIVAPKIPGFLYG